MHEHEQEMDEGPLRRRRASKACLRCNARKVRCDATMVKTARCTNCHLDNQACVVRQGMRRKMRRNLAQDPSNSPVEPTAIMNEVASFDAIANTTFPTQELVEIPKLLNLNKRRFDDISQTDMPCPTPRCSLPHLQRRRSSSTSFINGAAMLEESEISPGIRGYLPFTCFHFLTLEELPCLPSADARILEQSSCLHIPTRPALDDFVREYFLHVHPNLPMLDEGRFWGMYHNEEKMHGNSSRISLFLFQALLFASCNYVSLGILRQCGFSSIRDARGTLYQRAKILFDCQAENEASVIAQGALLLSYYSTNSERHLNTSWLTIAIQSAKTHGAHLYREDRGLTRYSRKMKKRLWWCCVLRDRILPLGLRRPLQITHNHFDFSYGGLVDEDFADDIGKSKVYDAATQRLLAKIIIAECKLAIEMTDIITTLYPSDIPHFITTASAKDFNSTSVEADRCKKKLIDWYNTINSWVCGIRKEAHASVILYTSLMYVYYHSARLALCHHNILALSLWTTPSKVSQHSYSQQLDIFRGELRTAAAAVTHIVQDLLSLDLAQHLPVSAVAYTALPLVVSALDIQLSPSASQLTGRRRIPNAYDQAMMLYKNQYDGTEEVYLTMERILTETELLSRKFHSPTSAHLRQMASFSSFFACKDWYEMFLKEPKLHLRLALSFDLCFSRGRFPEDSDFPEPLRTGRFDNYHQTKDAFFGGCSIETAFLTSLPSQETRAEIDDSPESYTNAVGSYTDLDFMDLFTEDIALRGSDVSDYGTDRCDTQRVREDNSHDESEDNNDNWEELILGLFSHAIPG
ncbi:fungal-specific transcription factor domain-containing protein [Halenospora varia]|nr:fungal-specific transcription factor domain-containing protein [Halenospora varia]